MTCLILLIRTFIELVELEGLAPKVLPLHSFHLHLIQVYSTRFKKDLKSISKSFLSRLTHPHICRPREVGWHPLQ
nr:hypothetical protein Iba_chr10eCG14040 [Ipomoea batatas]